MTRLRRRVPAWAWFGALNAMAIAAYFLVPGDGHQPVIYSAVGIASGTVIIVKARSTGHRVAWYAFGATQLLWAGGDLVWALYPIVTGRDAPYPSLGDVFYLAAYPFAMLGVVVHTLRQVGDDAKKVFLDAGMIGLVLAIGGWEVVVSPYLAQANVSLSSDMVGFLYPGLGLALLSLSVILFHGAGARNTSNRLLAFAITLTVCADLKYAGDLLDGVYHQGIWYDAGWLLSYAVWAMAALHPSAAAKPVPVGNRRSALRPSRLLLPSSLVLLVILVVRELQGSHASMIVLLGLGGAVFLLSLMRIQGLVKELHVELRNADDQRRSYRSLMYLASDAIFISQEDRYVEANVRACELTGYSRAELLGLSVGVLSSATPAADTARISAQLDRGESVVAQVALTHKDGAPIPVEVSACLLPDGRLQSIVRDISERMHAERALRASEERFRTVFESPAAGMAVASVDGTILQVNHTLARLLSTEADRLVGQTLGDLICDEDRALVQEAFARYTGGTEESAFLEVRFLESGGGVVWVELALAVDASLVSDPIVVVHVVDQTLARELEARLHQSQKMEAVGELAGGVAHDFNNLLSVIVNYTRFVQDVVPAGGHAARDLEEVVKAAGRGERLVRQLLAFSRRDHVRLEDLEVDTVIAEVADLLQRTVREGIRLDLHLEARGAVIRVDPVQLEHMLMNLAANARDAMPGGGTLRISTYVAGAALDESDAKAANAVHIVVSDTGSGMTDEVRARAFEPFFTTKERGSGTGLGLATVYGAVKSWGGDIEVCPAPCGGTTFDVWIPVSNAVPPLPRGSVAVPAFVPNATVLVAEDEAPLRVVAQRILEGAGYRVLLAETPEAALDLVRSGAESVDLLLTDVVMPGLSGKALAEQVLAFEPGIRVLYMSGYPDDIVTDHGLFVSGEAYLQKPFSAKQLVAQVDRVLSQTGGPPAPLPSSVLGGSR